MSTIIVDLSEYQGNVDFSQLKSQVSLVILRDQAGFTHPDARYVANVAGCKEYGIPFATYAYFKGLNVADAVHEAEADIAKMKANSGSRFAVVDVETMTVTSGKASDLRAAVNAYISDLRAKGFSKVVIYSGEYFYNANGLSACSHDGVWLAKYSATRPATPCDLWQYTSSGSLHGISGKVDLSTLTGSKPLSWFLGVLEVGSTVTVKRTATNYQTGEKIASFVLGQSYKILQVKDVNQSHSKKAYLLAGINSWVLEQDIAQA